MAVRLSANHFYPLKKEPEGTSEKVNGGCFDPEKVFEIRKENNCTDQCIPTIFSSLFDAR
jgi:hypothetical protein